MSRRLWRGFPRSIPSHSTALTAAIETATAPSCVVQRRNASQHSFTTSGDVTPAEYADRRRRFLACVPPHSVVLLPAADDFSFSRDIAFPHRQDSLFFHLFGLSTPLRRQLAPASSRLTYDVRATMAVLARFADTSTHTLLCVPGPTTDPETLVWASERTSWETYAEACAPCASGDGSVASTSAVISNKVGSVLDAVCDLIARMIAQKLEAAAAMAAAADGKSAATRDSGQDRRTLLGLAPQLLAAYPQQLRWDGRRYRMSTASGVISTKTKRSSRHSKTPPAATFRHPLEAFFTTLDATAFNVPLPRPLFGGGTAAANEPPWTSVTLHYKTAQGYTPGLVGSTVIETTAAAPVREVRIATPSCTPTSPVPPPSPATRGAVRLPIHRVDTHAWSYRRVKCPSQARQHLRSARATEHAFVQLMRSAATTTSEHNLHCVFQRSVCDAAAHFGAAARVCSAYIPVIAGGARGSEIHYTDNCRTAAAGALVRVDAGIEVDGVPTDCTRTFPIGTHEVASPAVARLYDGLLRLQHALLRRVAPGVAVADVARLHLEATQSLLCSLGVDVRNTAEPSQPDMPAVLVDATAEEREQRVPMSLVRGCFCAHAFGHLFGIDLHEEWGSLTPAASTSAPAAPHIFHGGVVHTVEPGIYIPSLECAKLFGIAAPHLPAAYHAGVGVQVEDDVLVLPPLSGAPGSDAADAACPWPRGVYLQHVLAAFARYFCGSTLPTSTPSFSFQLPSVAVLRCREHLQALLDPSLPQRLPPHEANVVAFLFAQRTAMEGIAAASTALAADVALAQQLTYVASPAYAEAGGVAVPEAAEAAWYPYAVVVLTATVPKDRECLESAMRLSAASA